MEGAAIVERMVKKESEDVEYEAGGSSYNLKEEPRVFDSTQEEMLKGEDEEEVKPPIMVLVPPYCDDVSDDKCDEQNIFDENLKEEPRVFDSTQEEMLKGEDEEEVKPPIMVLVQPYCDDVSDDKCDEQNIFDEADRIPKVGDMSKEQEEDSCQGMGTLSTPCDSSCSQKCKLIISSSDRACSSVTFATHIPIGSCKSTYTPKKYNCDHCNRTFNKKHNLFVHTRIHTGERPYQCDKCDASFITACNLTIHRRKHTEQPYHCDECGASFTQSSNLIQHKKTHTGERPYRCDECDASYIQPVDLKIHKRKHTGERPYQCDECDASFIRSSDLLVHKRTHTGECPYRCDVCDASFSQSNSLKKHKRKHTGERPYQCDECKASFTQSSTLKKHKRKHTG